MNIENDEKMKKVLIDMATKSEAIENLLVDYNSDNKRIIDKAKMEHLENDMSIFFEELNDIKKSGEMNMFGAPKWLRDNYDLSKDESDHVFKLWSEGVQS